jgi:beta-glucosidase
VRLEAGSSTAVTFQVSRYDLSVWDVVTQQWTIARGQWGAAVGASSRDRRLTGTFVV